MNKKKKTILIVALLLVVFIGSISYALWSVTLEQTDSNIVKTGCFTVDMLEQTEKINLPEEYPITDEAGKTYTPFTFTIQNTCTIDSSYSVNLKVEDGTTLEHQYVKVALNNDAIRVLTDYEKATDEDKYQLTTGTLAGASAEGAEDGESVTYNLRLWLDQDTPESQMSKDFIAKVVVENITTTISSEIMASADYSYNGSDVIVNYYTDGKLKVTGAGEMASGMIFDQLVADLQTKESFSNVMASMGSLSEYGTIFVMSSVYMSFGAYTTFLESSGLELNLGEITNNQDLYTELLKIVETDTTLTETDKQLLPDILKEVTTVIKPIKSVEISEGITKIGGNNFIYFENVNIVLPSSIAEIGSHAFESTDIEIALNSGLEKIGESAFENSGITTIELPETLDIIDYYAFRGSDLKSVSVNYPIRAMVSGIFENCSELETVYWSSNAIVSYTFANAPKLTTVIIDENVTSIDATAFDDLTVNPNLVLKFRTAEENKTNITGIDFTKYNVEWGYTD